METGAPVRVGIVGCGLRGRRHVACLGGFPDVRIEALCDPSGESLSAAAGLSGAPLQFQSLAGFLAADLDAVVLAVPAHLNASVAREVLRCGHPTLLEKPPAMTLAETRDLKALADMTGARCMVGVNRRFHPVIADGLAAVRARGPIVQIVAEFHKSMDRQIAAQVLPPAALAAHPSAFLMESPIHAIDLTRYAAGSPVERVTAAARRCFHDYPDSHAALVEFANGTLATLTFNYTGDVRLERYEFHGRNISAFIENSLTSGTTLEIAADGVRTRTTRMTDSGLAAQNRAFIDGVKAGGCFAPPAPGLDEAIETMALAEAIAGQCAPRLGPGSPRP